MEVSLLVVLFTFYLAIRYFVTDHDTPSDKDRKRFQRGIRLIQARNYTDAFTYFDEAVKQYPNSAVAYAFRGKCQLTQENYYSAIYDLTQAISRDNTQPDCYLDRGIAYYQVGQFADAFREFDKAVWYYRDEKPDAYRWRAIARLKLLQMAQAENDLKRAVLMGDENSAYLLTQPPFTTKEFQNN